MAKAATQKKSTGVKKAATVKKTVAAKPATKKQKKPANKMIPESFLKIGQKAPSFSLKNESGETLTLKSFAGKKLVIYFYPKDDTPGCTAEACSLRDNYELMQSKGYVVVGVSPDSAKSHIRFAEKYHLNFPLIPDTDKKILNDYGVWGLKKFMGREYEGVIRTTFLINEDGIIDEVITKVDTKNHAIQILNG